MRPGTDYVSPENRVATSDARFDMRLTENFDDDAATSGGWTWIAAILIAGTLIVSGYLDQEPANFGGDAPSRVAERHAANTTASQTVVANANTVDARSFKGY